MPVHDGAVRCHLIQFGSLDLDTISLLLKKNADVPIPQVVSQYEYDIEVPPHDLGYEITDKDGEEFEHRLGAWLLEIIQTQMEKHAAADRNNNT